MARQQVVSVTYTCDVCGDEIPESDAEGAAQSLGWEDADYTVDLCATHQAELADILDQLKMFADAGQRSGPARRRATPAKAAAVAPSTAGASPTRGRRRSGAASSAPASSRRRDLPAIRSWAQEHGHQVGERGRLPGRVVAAYDQFHSSNPASVTRKRSTGRAAVASASD